MFVDDLGAAGSAADVWAALERLVQQVAPSKLVTVTTVEEAGTLARRSYSNMPEAYPVSGTKRTERNAWTEVVLDRHETFVANTLAEIAQVFPDHELIGSLGCGSVVNLPLFLGGEIVATLNLLDAEGHYTPERVARIEAELRLPALAAVLAAGRLG